MPSLRFACVSFALPIATVCLQAACGGAVSTQVSSSGPGPDAPEAGVPVTPPPTKRDAGGPTYPVTKCTTPRAADPLGPEPTPVDFFVSHPPPQLQNQGGPTLKSPRIVPIFFPDDPLAPDLEAFVSSFGCTDYWRKAVGEYGIGDAIASPAVHMPDAAPKNITDAQIEAWLAKQIASKSVEAPTPNSVYVIFYPAGTTIEEGGATSCQEFGGYHTNISLPDGTPVAYAAIPRCTSFQRLSTLDGATGAASHEIIEASTDPYNKDTPAYAYVDDAHGSFMFVLGGENGDLCAQEPDAFYKPQGYPFTVQRNWSNRSAKTGDPCLPSSGQPFFTAAPKLTELVDLQGMRTQGVVVAPGSTKTIDVDLFADSPGVSLDVDVMDASRGFGGGGGGSSYALDKNVGKSGDTLHLTITSPAASSQPEIFMVVVSSGNRMRVAWVGAVGH